MRLWINYPVKQLKKCVNGICQMLVGERPVAGETRSPATQQQEHRLSVVHTYDPVTCQGDDRAGCAL